MSLLFWLQLTIARARELVSAQPVRALTIDAAELHAWAAAALQELAALRLDTLATGQVAQQQRSSSAQNGQQSKGRGFTLFAGTQAVDKSEVGMGSYDDSIAIKVRNSQLSE